MKLPSYTFCGGKLVYSYFEKGCRKNVHATTPKGNMGHDQYSVPNYCSCRTYFCCFPLAIANICPWPLVPFFTISLENRADKTTRNTFRDCRVHFFRQPFSKQLYVPTFQFFFSLQLTLTLLAASICHFHIAALNFSCFFFLYNELGLLSFFLFFFFVFVLFCLSL